MTPRAPHEASRSVPDPLGLGLGDDPHHAKIAPDDPRLRLTRSGGRALRKGPAVALVVALVVVIVVALLAAFEPAGDSAGTKGPRTGEQGHATPVIPDAIRLAPDKPVITGPALHARLEPGDAGLPFGAASPGERGEAARNGGAASHDPYGPERLRQLDEEQRWKAQSSGVLFGVRAADEAPAARSAGPSLSDVRPSGAPAASNAATSDDPNNQAHKNAFVDQVGAGKSRSVSEHRVEQPRSPYEVKAGSVLPAVLLTAINSDLPGPVIGQVRENVYDTVTGNHLLIPQGSRILASYDSLVAWGQERVLVCWNRLIFPNGNSLTLGCMPAGDLEGAAGLSDEVNEHWGRLLKGAAVSSLLAATSQAVTGNTEGFSPTVPQVWARNAGSEMNQIGQRLTARNLNIQPTLTVRAGYAVNVMVTEDLIVPPYRSPDVGLAQRAAPPGGP